MCLRRYATVSIKRSEDGSADTGQSRDSPRHHSAEGQTPIAGLQRSGKGISIPFHYDLLLLSPDREIKFEDIVGTPATITIFLSDKPGATPSPDGGPRKRIINGIIGSFTAADITNQYASYQATLVPQLWKLTRNADCRIFQDQSAVDIIKSILKENNVNFTEGSALTAGRYQTRGNTASSTARPTSTSSPATDAEEEGIFYLFEHSAMPATASGNT